MLKQTPTGRRRADTSTLEGNEREASRAEVSILVLGVGNPILSDDGVGIHIVRELSRRIQNPVVNFGECSLAGFGMLDIISGYDRLIIVDAITWGRKRPGSFLVLGIEELQGPERLRNFHALSLPGALKLARKMEIPVPEEIVVFAVEVADCTTFSEACTERVAKAIPTVAGRVASLLEKWMEEYNHARGRNRSEHNRAGKTAHRGDR